MFCTECGRQLLNGVCPDHDRSAEIVQHSSAIDQLNDDAVQAPRVVEDRPITKDRTSIFVVTSAIVGAIVVALLVALVLQTRSQRAQLNQVRMQDSQSIHQLAGQLHNETEAVNGLANRLGILNAKVNATPDPAVIAKTVGASVFTITTTDQDQGTAWVIQSAGGTSELITNFHVVATEWDNGGRNVMLSQGSATYPATISTVAQGADLAQITTSQSFPTLTISSSQPSVGDSVVVIGAPFDLGGSVSTGIVSALRTIDGCDLVCGGGLLVHRRHQQLRDRVRGVERDRLGLAISGQSGRHLPR